MIPIICLLACQGAFAIDISFSASNGRGSVGITDSYDVDDSVGVSGRSSASFGDGVRMTDSHSLSGSGDANVNQILYGSGWGADYVIKYALETFGASSIEGSGGATLAPDSGSVSRSVSTAGSSETISELRGTQGGDFLVVDSYAFGADISTTQNIAVGQSVAASQNVNAEGVYAGANGTAWDADGNYAIMFAYVEDGTMKTAQTARAGNGVSASQELEIEAQGGQAGISTGDAEGNWAGMFSYMEDGTMKSVQDSRAGNSARTHLASEINASYGAVTSMSWDADLNCATTSVEMYDEEGDGILITEQTAEAEGSAEAHQITTVEADRGVAFSGAEDDEGNVAETWAEMANGTLQTYQGSWAGEDFWFEGASAGQWWTQITAESGVTGSRGKKVDGKEAETWAEMANGTLQTYQGSWAGEDFWFEGASAGQWWTQITAESGVTGSRGKKVDGKEAETWAEMVNGTLWTLQSAFADEIAFDSGAQAGQTTLIEAENGSAGSYAKDTEGSYVEIHNEVENGTLDTFQWAVAGNSAEGYQNTSIEGEFAYAFCEANNTGSGYYAYVDNFVLGDAYLHLMSEASVNASEARVHQESYAEGNSILLRANSTTQGDERIETGTFTSESFAWTNSTGEGAVITEL